MVLFRRAKNKEVKRIGGEFSIAVTLDRFDGIDLVPDRDHRVDLTLDCDSCASIIDRYSNDRSEPKLLKDSQALSEAMKFNCGHGTVNMKQRFLFRLRSEKCLGLPSEFNVSLKFRLLKFDNTSVVGEAISSAGMQSCELLEKGKVEMPLSSSRLTHMRHTILFDNLAAITVTAHASLTSIELAANKTLKSDERKESLETLETPKTKETLAALSTIRCIKAFFTSRSLPVPPKPGTSDQKEEVDVVPPKKLKWDLDSYASRLSVRLTQLFDDFRRLLIERSEVELSLNDELDQIRWRQCAGQFLCIESNLSSISKSTSKRIAHMSHMRLLKKMNAMRASAHPSAQTSASDSLVSRAGSIVEQVYLPDAASRDEGSRPHDTRETDASSTQSSSQIHTNTTMPTSTDVSATCSQTRSSGGEDSSGITMESNGDETSGKGRVSKADSGPSRPEKKLRVMMVELRTLNDRVYLYSDVKRSNSNQNRDCRLKSSNKGPHLIVFVPGLQGKREALEMYRSFLCILLPNEDLHFLMSACNENTEGTDIRMLAETLLDETITYVESMPVQPTRISFVAHSMGGLIVRCMVARAASLTRMFHTLLTLNTPHCGLAFAEGRTNQGINLMTWLRWTGSTCMQQMRMKDAFHFKDSFLYHLSDNGALALFKNVLLLGSKGDHFVDPSNAIIQTCKACEEDLSMQGRAYEHMVRYLNDSMAFSRREISVVKYTVSLQPGIGSTQEFLVGSTEHNAVLQDAGFVEKLLSISAAKYFL